MKVEVLVATMNATDFSLIEKMNIQTDVVIANQSDCCSFEETKYDGVHTAKLVTTNTKGASINRNIAIDHSSDDIVLLCDDDQVLPQNYEKTIVEEFLKHRKAQAIKFYCESSNPKRQFAYKRPSKFKRGRIHNALSTGVHALAVHREALFNKNLRFFENIGPGMEYDCGEDSLFLAQLCRSKIGFYLSPTSMGEVLQETSTWFKGYNAHYFTTVGYVYYLLYGKAALLATFRRALKSRNKKGNAIPFWEMVSLMKKGIRVSKNEFKRKTKDSGCQ